jgi:hypothetical protein
VRVLLRKIDLLRLQCYSTPLRPLTRRTREETRACRRPRSAACRALALRFRPH